MTFARLTAWLDASAVKPEGDPHYIDVLRIVPFLLLHVSCAAVFWVGASPTAVFAAVFLYLVRMLAITGFYHRYFSHRSFSTSRPVQFIFGCLGAMAVQRGPMWWASHHRYHHAHADRSEDPHSPHRHGFWWAHCGWFLANGNYLTRQNLVRDLARYPELRFLDRFDAAMPVVLAVSLYCLGAHLAATHPGLHTSGLQLLVWGFCVSTVALYHGTFTINSLAHVFGEQPFATPDRSRNNLTLALITLGEGWHNNHHFDPRSARQGFGWRQPDVTFYALRGLQALGLIWDLKAPRAGMLRHRGVA